VIRSMFANLRRFSAPRGTASRREKQSGAAIGARFLNCWPRVRVTPGALNNHNDLARRGDSIALLPTVGNTVRAGSECGFLPARDRLTVDQQLDAFRWLA
jgi:hypothetical protein